MASYWPRAFVCNFPRFCQVAAGLTMGRTLAGVFKGGREFSRPCNGQRLTPAVPVHHCQVGADLTMGSLIKSPGGTIVTGGGYIVGRADLVEAAGARLTAPGVGLDAGAVPGETLRLMFQGAYLYCLEA